MPCRPRLPSTSSSGRRSLTRASSRSFSSRLAHSPSATRRRKRRPGDAMADLNDGRIDLHRPTARFVAFSVVAALLLVALGGRLFQLQVVNGDVYAGRAAADRTVEVPIPAPR